MPSIFNRRPTKVTSDALALLQHVWNHSPYRSHDYRGNAMYAALKLAITSGLDFNAEDINYCFKHFRAEHWFSGGGENLYSLACGSDRNSGNTPAAIAFETWYERPAYIWAEATKTPTRLHVGSEFTWEGMRVEVTSFKDDKKALIACSPDRSRRFTVTHEALMAKRAAYDALRRKHEKAIKAAQTFDELRTARAAASAEGHQNFRHFDIEILNDLITTRQRQIEQNLSPAERQTIRDQIAAERQKELDEMLPRWMAGEETPVNRFSSIIRCRVKDGRLETTNGNSVSLAAAKEALTFIRKHRKKGWTEDEQKPELSIDGHPLKSITTKGVTIGCTFFEWSEIDRITPAIQTA